MFDLLSSDVFIFFRAWIRLDDGDVAGARRFRFASYGLSIAGIITGITMLLIILYYLARDEKTHDNYNH